MKALTNFSHCASDAARRLFASLALLTMAAVLMAPARATAAIILTIDVSDSQFVTFAATGEAASTNTSSADFRDGITLADFFRVEPESGSFTISGTLSPAYYGTPTYTRFALEEASNLNIYVNSAHPQSGNPQFFRTDVAAFTGSVIVDMSIISESLPLAGTQGTLYSGYGSSLVEIGTWAAVPEPGYGMLLSLFGVGTLAFQTLKRRRFRYSSLLCRG